MNLFRLATGHPDEIFKRAIFFHRKYKKAKDEKLLIRAVVFGRFANYYARKYNLELYGAMGQGIKIWHGNIVINGNAILGENVTLHGNNCIGNSEYMGKAPRIGNNVEIGYGATVIGDITIADNVIIGANSLVNKNILERGAVVVGNPAKIVKYLKRED